MPSPQDIRFLILIVPIVLLFAGLKRPVYGVIGYMFIVFFKVNHYYPFMASIKAELLFAVVVLIRLAMSGDLKNNLLQDNTSINKGILFLSLSIALSFAIAWNHQYSWDNAVYHYIKTLVLFMMIVGSVNNTTDLKIFVSFYLGMYLYMSYEPMYGYISQIGGSVHLYGTNYIAEVGSLSGHVALANKMNQMIPIAWFYFFARKNRNQKIFAALCILVFLLALIGSGSRGGVIGMAVWVALIVWFSENRLKMFIPVLLIGVILIVSQGSSIVRTASRIDSTATEGRLVGLTHGVGMLLKGNILGVGPGCYPLARGAYFSYTMESHNIYGQIMGDLGVPGIIITILLAKYIFKALIKVKCISQKRNDKFLYYLMLAVMTSLVTRLVISMGSHGLYFPYWYIIAAIVVSAAKISETGEKELEDTSKNDKFDRFKFK